MLKRVLRIICFVFLPIYPLVVLLVMLVGIPIHTQGPLQHRQGLPLSWQQTTIYVYPPDPISGKTEFPQVSSSLFYAVIDILFWLGLLVLGIYLFRRFLIIKKLPSKV